MDEESFKTIHKIAYVYAKNKTHTQKKNFL